MSSKLQVSVIDLATMLLNAYSASKDLDAEYSFESFVSKMNRTYQIDQEDVEKLLALCNFNDEKESFESCDGKSFEDLVANLGIKFNKDYNWICQ